MNLESWKAMLGTLWNDSPNSFRQPLFLCKPISIISNDNSESSLIGLTCAPTTTFYVLFAIRFGKERSLMRVTFDKYN